MAITELVFPALKPTEEAETGFFDELPDAMRPTFHVPGGPITASLARVLASSPSDAESHSGYMAVISTFSAYDGSLKQQLANTCFSTLAWESLEKIEAFIKTPGFAQFKTTMAETSSGPTVLQFFEATPDVIPQNTVQGASHLFVVKAVGDRAQVEAARKAWGGVTAAFAGVAGADVAFHSGDGRQNVEGQFAGISGWKSLEVR